MIHFHPDQQHQLRRACDRCHRSKLKCFRDHDEPCQRCLRANVRCVSSPPVTSRRQTQDVISELDRQPPTQPIATTSHLPTETLNLNETDIDANVASWWRGRNTGDIANFSSGTAVTSIPIDRPSLSVIATHMDVDSGLFQTNDGTSRSRDIYEPLPPTSSITGNSGPGPPIVTERISATSGSNCNVIDLLQKLSELSIDLMRHLDMIPNVAIIDRPQPEDEKLFDIDQTLHMSQLFIDLTNDICSRLPPSSKATSRQIVEAEQSTFSLDPASELLVFSCYLRLLETYDKILRQMRVSITHKTPNGDIQYPFRMPDFTIGSFSLPSTTETQSILLINLMDRMVTRARELVAEMSSPKHTSGYRGDFESYGGVTLVIVPDLALKAIRVREDAISRLVEDLKKSILRPGPS
ncbi:uncharacterized protein F4822DRAFT_115796 [Hypoxylon trugodes]|uniref:uncharacterized protein n=1 Tax=Hypoxylon trugodes TaxID=326681 RepID=UPI00218E2F1F|nr:uncharacterized protein F4822DRAFT_115796 [Hypoxylon trugodes]KAI1392120.1 hypothetical protein F4822DRAFT_115796 [Hypoxylon trugodes]